MIATPDPGCVVREPVGVRVVLAFGLTFTVSPSAVPDCMVRVSLEDELVVVPALGLKPVCSCKACVLRLGGGGKGIAAFRPLTGGIRWPGPNRSEPVGCG